MELTIEVYRRLIELLKNKGYTFCLYDEADHHEKTVILRHDVDFTLSKAVEMAEVEHELGVKSTYFILVTTDFYNIFSKRSYERLMKIISLGHEIGLHFDEKLYGIQTVDEMKKYVEMEADILGKYLNREVKVVSMH
ncbi:Polysaccharide deacetylase OS=Ureibacillus acetophenoni OX=614649 GN=SAMN05877842_104127 PE=4 SV=1 [Ureibacillus acetophenoni]